MAMVDSERPPRSPVVTITMVVFNGLRWLPQSVGSVIAQTVADFEFLILDNASSDGSLEWLQSVERTDPRLHLYSSHSNEGFARGQNLLLARARADAVLVLNQDVVLDAGFLRAAVAALEHHPDAASVQPRLRRLDPDGHRLRRLDSTGLVMGRDRRAVSRGQGSEDGPEHAEPGPVFGADGPAPLYRRVALLDARVPRKGGGLEYFDEDFFMYKEDVDLAWRLQVLGWTSWYEPRALGWHARTAPGSVGLHWGGAVRSTMRVAPWIRATSWRNQRLTQVKNEPIVDFFRDAPWILGREAASLAFCLIVDPRRLTILPSLFRLLPAAMRKRRFIHRWRRQPRAARARRVLATTRKLP